MLVLFERTHLEHGNFALGEETVTATGYVAFGQTGKADAVKGYDLIADLLEDAAYDAVLAGVDLEAYVAAILVGELQCVGDNNLVIEGYAVTDGLFVLAFEIAVKNDGVDLLLTELRVCEFGCQIAVVGEQQHTGRIAVKTTNGVDALRASVLDDVHHRAALLGIVGGGDAVLGFVQKYIYLPLALNRLVMEHHLVRRQHLCAEAIDHLAVDCDDASLDEVVGFATAAEPCIGEVLVQTNRLRGILITLVVGNLLALRIDAAVVLGLSGMVVVSLLLQATAYRTLTALRTLCAKGRALHACAVGRYAGVVLFTCGIVAVR